MIYKEFVEFSIKKEGLDHEKLFAIYTETMETLKNGKKYDEINKNTQDNIYMFAKIFNINPNSIIITSVKDGREVMDMVLDSYFKPNLKESSDEKTGEGLYFRKKKLGKRISKVKGLGLGLSQKNKHNNNKPKMPYLIKTGRGKEKEIDENYEISKYYIDMKKFKKGYLCLKYKKNQNIVPTFKSFKMSDNLKLIMNLYMEEKFDEKLYISLTDFEKSSLNTLGKILDIDEFIDNKLMDEFQEKYNVLIGEMQAGNDNPKLRKEFKLYILNAIRSGLITQNEEYIMIIENSL